MSGRQGAPERRVVITGLGVVTPIGSDVEAFWQGALAGASAVRRITRFDASGFRSRIAAEIDHVCLDGWVEPKRAKWLDRYSALALLAGLQAIRDGGLEGKLATVRERAGVYVGSALGGVACAESEHTAFVTRGPARISPSLALSVFGGAASTNLAQELGLHGPNVANANSCASGAVAIGEAFRLIRAGGADLMLAGGVETPLAPLTFGAFAAIRALSERNAEPARASRPFDRARDGFVMAEGAALLLLESAATARRRGARVYAEVLGYGTTNDAYHMTAPRPDGSQARRCIELALADAALPPTAIGLVSAHASATPLGDRAEARALADVLGAHAPLVFATKGMHGHALGATPAMETALLALALARGWAPPCTNLDAPDPDVALRFTGASAVPVHARYGLKNAFGFGGINVSLVLGAPTDGAD
ncbi:MAG TPA: beta-ketoacyl-[acyl-carrier-protein] synthase family protein [Chloroflexota bacterium]|nr:beta-ketoacyl-[acyl-carrier-protein] synthase family protein [Chloroflexota bacterium]